MYRLRTTSDFVFFAVVALALSALGAAMLLFPRERLPEEDAAYRQVGGVLREFKDESPRRGTAVRFAIEGNRTQFVSNSAPTRAAAKSWEVGRTSVQFFVLGQVEEGRGLVPAYGLSAQGQNLRSLREDIRFHNAGVTAWPAIMALAMGVLGIFVVVVRWRQQSAA